MSPTSMLSSGRPRARWPSAAIAVLGATLYLAQAVLAHSDHPDKKKPEKKMDSGGGMHGANMTQEAQETRDALLVLLHAFIASIVVWVTMPLATAFVAGRRPEAHRVTSGANTTALILAGLIAAFGFADGDSKHALIGASCLFLWSLQTAYGVVRHFFYRSSMPIKPHRFFGVALFVYTMIAWLSGVLHLQGSCDTTARVQMCNAHFYLGGFFVLLGIVHIYYPIERASELELPIIAFGAMSELVGEGVGDSILFAIDPEEHPWNQMAKQLHLGSATVWLLCAVVAWIAARRYPATLTRGLALCLGLTFHVSFMFIHSEGIPRTKALHLTHALALTPVILLRFVKYQRTFALLLLVGGLAFAAAADPIAEDAKIESPSAYAAVVVFLATVLFAIHVYIKRFVLDAVSESSAYPDSVWERSGLSGPCNFCSRLCCCLPRLPRAVSPTLDEEHSASRVRTNGAVEYAKVQPSMQGDMNGNDVDDLDLELDDVTTAPPSKKGRKAAVAPAV